MKRRGRFYTILLAILCFVATALPAAAAETLEIAVNQSRVMNAYGVERVAVANPDIADVLVVSGSEVLLVGKAPGVTTLHIWSVSGLASYEVKVAADDPATGNEIRTILGYGDIRVSKVGKTVILEGTVRDQYQKNRAETVAAAYGEKVVNLLELTHPSQVKIEAKVIEIDRAKEKDLGLQWGNSPSVAPGGFSLGQSFSNPVGGGMPFGQLGGYSAVNAQLSALIKNGSAKILSQPHMITLSGDKANIMVGGQIPVPMNVNNGQIAIEWKDYGIKLEIAPEINGEGLINSKVKAEVSSLDWNSNHQIEIGTNMKIPPLKMSTAETAIALASGQTMAIGGLISNETSRDVTKVPLLADIPILGSLFKSTSFTSNETELIILITPTIVDPAEYMPQSTQEMKESIKQDPWGGVKDDGKNKSADRR